MPKQNQKNKPPRKTHLCFSELLSSDPELSGLRAAYASKSAEERRLTAQWTYDAGIADTMFSAAIAGLSSKKPPKPKWPSSFAALAIDPEYAPALLTVGFHEYSSDHKEKGIELLLQLTQLSPDTEDWIEIIDKAGQELMDAGDAAATIRLYQQAVENQPTLRDFHLGLAWALCRGGRSNEALPLMEKAIETEPDSPELLNDYGRALLEAGRLEEAQAVLEKAVELSPDGYTLPKKNLEHLLNLRKKNPSSHRTKADKSSPRV